MKTEDILNEREKTHGDFEEVARRAHLMQVDLAIPPRLDSRKKIAIQMILLKLARIACGDPDFDDHWDDIKGYAELGRGKAKGVFGAGEPCKCPSKRREYFADTADGFKTIMTVDYCDECNKMHIVDCEQKEAKKEQFKDEFEFINKRIDNVVEWLKTISENLVKLNEIKNSTSSKMEHVGDKEWYDGTKCLPLTGKKVIAHIKSKNNAYDLNHTAMLMTFGKEALITLVNCDMDIGPFEVLKWKYAD